MERPNGDIVGSPRIRSDAWEKVSGEARYVDDLCVPGMWFGGTVRSPVAHGRIRAIQLDPDFDWSAVRLLTARDLPGPNVVSMIQDDHPILAREKVRFVSEAIVLVAAPTREVLSRALEAVEVEIEEAPAILTIEEALRDEANILSEYRIQSGDLEAGWAASDRVIEGTYRTGSQEHLYLETHGVLATPRADGGIEIDGSLQCPYYVHTALQKALALPAEKVVIRQTTTGGAFGGKEDYPSVLSAHAAVLALAAGHPVKMVYERSEDIRATTKRHPSRVRHRTGVTSDGTLVASEIDVVLDGGAYTTLSPVVLSRAILHAQGVYRVPHVAIRGRAVATHTPPNGAFRGFGAPQSLFAVERQMDLIARELGIDPVAVRRRNLLRDGDEFPFGQRLERDVSAGAVLERVVELSGYEGRSKRPGRGMGLSVYMHGGGFTGSGEERIAGRAQVRLTADGNVEILVSNVEMGQGASTVLPMIASQALGVAPERVRHAVPDTSRVPNSGPTVASRTTMIVGRIVIDACRDLVEKAKAALAARPELPPFKSLADGAAHLLGPEDALVGEATYKPPPGMQWDDDAYRGDAYKAYSWGADVVEVEVDPATLEIRPLRATVVVEIGRAIHPVLAIGQVEGGTLQALGWASMEEAKFAAGKILNDRVATYIIPTSLDSPEMQVDILEVPDRHGAFGAKGLGELPMDGAAPAFAAAVDEATGGFATEIPLTPERLLAQEEAGR